MDELMQHRHEPVIHSYKDKCNNIVLWAELCHIYTDMNTLNFIPGVELLIRILKLWTGEMRCVDCLDASLKLLMICVAQMRQVCV